MVSSILSTCPCLTPFELALPKPMISSLPNSFFRPAIAAIFVVPISSPTIRGCCSCCIRILFLVLVWGRVFHPNHLSCESYIQLLVHIHACFAQHLLIKQQQPFKLFLIIGTITKLNNMVAYH